MAHRSLTFLSAFSGLGGLDLGLEAAGFITVGCIECDDTARRSLKGNRGSSWPLLEPGDIHDVAAELVPAQVGLERGELSVLAGGPPCQPFSKAAQWAATGRSGLNDPRARCLIDFLALVESFLPHVLLIENVPGFAQGAIAALPTLRGKLATINRKHGTRYDARWAIVDCADYGVPQHRKRAIVIALRDPTSFRWPETTHKDLPATAWDAIGELVVRSSLPRTMGKWAALLPSIPEGQNYLWHTSRGGGQPIFGYRTRYWSFLLKLARNEPSWTLPAQPGPSTGPFHWDNRPLAIEEMLALQTFPTDWLVEGDYRARVRQVGNATPPLLAEVIARSIAEQIFDDSARTSVRYAVPRRGDPPRPVEPAGLPVQFRELVGDHPDHPGAGRGPRPRIAGS